MLVKVWGSILSHDNIYSLLTPLSGILSGDFIIISIIYIR